MWWGFALACVGLAGPSAGGLVTPCRGMEASLASTGPARVQRIDLELQDAEIHEVLRTFADIGRVNIVPSAGVQGRVTARFRNTPWTEALAQILSALALEAQRDGNIIYVSPR